MKLNENFILHISDGETFLVPTGKASFSGMVRGNKTLGAVLELLKNEVTEEEILAAMTARFNAPADVIKKDVDKALASLEKIGAIDQ